MVKKKKPVTFWSGPKTVKVKFKETKKRKLKPLFKPVRLNDKKYVKTVNTKHLTWPQAQIRYPKMKAFGDADKDGILNGWDCKPFNKKKHGWDKRGNSFNRERSTHVVMMTPDKFIRTTMREAANNRPGKPKQTQEEYEKEVVRDYDLTETETRNRLKQGKGRTPSKEEMKEIQEYQADKRKYMEKLKNVIRSRKGKMDVPFLEYDKEGRPEGHEGRHRAIAARELGVKRIPVTIAKRLKKPRDWKKIRSGEVYGAKPKKRKAKDYRYDLENEDEVISSKSADISIQEQREYGEEKPETLQYLRDELKEDL